jgi:hypothetical protein
VIDLICDGIAMGCKKDYLDKVHMEDPKDPRNKTFTKVCMDKVNKLQNLRF